MLKRLALRFLCSRWQPPPEEVLTQSKHYVPREPPQKFLDKLLIMYKLAPSGLKIKECPFCPKHNNNEASNLYTLNVHKESGCFHCFRCSESGSYLKLKAKLLGIEDGSLSTNQKVFDETPQSAQQPRNGEENNSSSHTQSRSTAVIQAQYFALHQQLHTGRYSDVKEYLTKQRGLTQETLNAYKIGAGQETFYEEEGQKVLVKVIYFPMFQGTSEKQRKKFRQEVNELVVKDENFAVKLDDWRINTEFARLVKYKIRGASADTKQHMRQSPAGAVAGFFGYNLVKEDTKQVVITEGQFDAMSVYQHTGKVALSLPQGASHLPDQLIPLLERFEKVILWMDNDKAGELNAPKIGHKIGEKRTFIVNNEDRSLKDANDVLRKKPELMKTLLEQASTQPSNNILKFGDLQEKVRFNIFNAELKQGMQSKVFPFFNKRVKGFRTGQLTILSGPTGCGKTTLLSQLSMDFCKQGMGTLWGSFEIKNQVLAYTMISQHSQKNLKKSKEKFQYYSQSFAKLPLYWLSFHGSTDLEKVFGTIEYAIQKYQVSHVVIDTLQFLLSDQAEGYEKFDLQDRTVGRLRNIATNMNVHVTVVIHPKKVDEGVDLGIHTIFGSSKSVQEADNVWMIQQRQKFKVFEIKKNRYDGELGKVALGFNKGTKSFFELKQSQLDALYAGKQTIDDVVARRQQDLRSLQEQNARRRGVRQTPA